MSLTQNNDCLFCNIISKEIPSDIVYEDDEVIGFKDINPQAPIHVLFIPKTHIPTVNDLTSENSYLVGKLFEAAKTYMAEQGEAEAGYRLAMNCNDAAGQTVYHIHLHCLAGRSLTWPPG